MTMLHEEMSNDSCQPDPPAEDEEGSEPTVVVGTGLFCVRGELFKVELFSAFCEVLESTQAVKINTIIMINEIVK